MKNNLLFLFCLCILSSSCSSNSSDVIDPLVTSTYVANVKSIIDNNCISCHSDPPVNAAPMHLTNAASVKEAIEDRGLIERIEEGSMPVTGTLTAAQIKIIKDWKAGGYK